MEKTLNEVEMRILGALIEKEMTTPDYYPLTLNGLTLACNQKSNRAPVLALDETEVIRGLDTLRHQGLALQSSGEGSRVPKYQHNLAAKLFLEPNELALLAELLLRGPQTLGELRSRASRMTPFDDLSEVETTLEELAERETPLTLKLPRQPGRKEQRYAQLLGGVPELENEESSPAPEAARLRVEAENSRLEQLETELSTLREEVAALKAEMAAFKAQFE
ncbi:MAG: DUF480 domain-containing protein [Desulfuromonas sp.]|nr:MAG: DUF480 domain-containing protein [Desulfuromonas sp.]